jgi:hypothetical protein
MESSSRVKIRLHLCNMHRDNAPIRLEFDDDCTLHQQIQPMLADRD